MRSAASNRDLGRLHDCGFAVSREVLAMVPQSSTNTATVSTSFGWFPTTRTSLTTIHSARSVVDPLAATGAKSGFAWEWHPEIMDDSRTEQLGNALLAWHEPVPDPRAALVARGVTNQRARELHDWLGDSVALFAG